ncbi:HAD family hydrolase [Marinobacterium jannaschii]|uniref:HAD family hydrolase n=1 Tax=Marinobacterium jannaschii TaxID=64970 RepID=UPI0004895619|nr:HAD-IA family hydrolase [Marinobacterium jannaschii]
MSGNIEVVLFDLGGVLIELQGQPVKNEWLRHPEDHERNWARWLRSPAAQAFERGESGPDAFAEAVIAEMDLTVDADTFIEHFTWWPKGLFPGTLALLEQLRQIDLTVALFSNINQLHWPRVMDEMRLDGKFDHYFASHLIGKAKPCADAFRYVAGQMQVAPGSVLFLDDNQVNVDGALAAGMQAFVVKGIEQTCALLSEKVAL